MKLNTRTARAVLSALYDLGLRLPFDASDFGLGAELEFKPVKPRRTVDANARYWVIVTALAKYMGDTKMGVHEDLLKEYHGVEWIKTPRGDKEVPKDRSSKLTRNDFSELMMIAERWAAEGQVSWDRSAA